MNKLVKFSRVCVVFVTWLLLITMVASAAGQPPALSIKIEKITDDAFPQVKVFASVSDAQGFPIKDLTADNFKISEGGKPVSGLTVTPFQNFEQPLAVALVMDTSGSMNGKPLTDSIQAAKDFNNSLAAQDVLGLVSFAAEVKQLQGLTTDRAAVAAQLDTLKAQGATALNDALVEAVGMLKNRSERRVVLLLTDGKQEGPSKYTADQVIDEAVRWSTPIYPVGFGNVDKNQLERFAQLTGGTAQINPDSTTVAAAFQTVLSMLREQYQVEFTSTLMADGLEHPLELSVEYQNGFASDTRNFTATPGQVAVEIPEPAAGQPLGGKVRISASGAGPAPVSQVDIFLDGSPLASVTNPPFEYLWDSTTVTPGTHTLNVVVTDQVGNKGEKSIDVQVRLPLLVELAFTDNQQVGGDVTMAVKIDALANVQKVTYLVDGAPVSEVTAPPFEYVWDSRPVSPGEHKFSVKVEDSNGYSAEDSVPVVVEMQQDSNLLWIALVVVLIAVGLIVPLSMRSRKKMVAAGAGPAVEAVARAGAVPSIEDATGTVLPGQGGYGQPVLVEVRGLNPGQVWPLSGGTLRLGRRKADNDIPLLGLSASRNQAVIECQADGYAIQSLVSDNPVKINGRPVANTSILYQGDVIEAGESSFRFEVRS